MKKTKEEILTEIISQNAKLHQIQDIDILLELILAEACRAVNADAGSIYIVENGMLAIKYALNNTLKSRLPQGEKLPFVAFSFPINESTIAGYAAKNACTVNEKDVYQISPSKKYKFGNSSDLLTNYKTVSNLTLPIINTNGQVFGVLQVLNALDDENNVIPFNEDDEIYLQHFATNIADALEHASRTRSIIMRMIRMSELRDPSETGTHIKRVSAYAIEIYDRYAFNKNISQELQTRFRDDLKIAALLHDVGKVAIPDNILKKPDRLTDTEYNIIKSHTWLGAQLFVPFENKFDSFVSDIVLHHHENFDGTGYPGNIKLNANINDVVPMSEGLKGEDIPLGARIIALADVYDALSCTRCYKEPWSDEKIIEELHRCSGTKFDPDVIKAFFEVYDRIQDIRKVYSDTHTE